MISFNCTSCGASYVSTDVRTPCPDCSLGKPKPGCTCVNYRTLGGPTGLRAKWDQSCPVHQENPKLRACGN
jgi:hypothetical protein